MKLGCLACFKVIQVAFAHIDCVEVGAVLNCLVMYETEGAALSVENLHSDMLYLREVITYRELYFK